jgi:hypothetical protein
MYYIITVLGQPSNASKDLQKKQKPREIGRNTFQPNRISIISVSWERSSYQMKIKIINNVFKANTRGAKKLITAKRQIPTTRKRIVLKVE